LAPLSRMMAREPATILALRSRAAKGLVHGIPSFQDLRDSYLDTSVTTYGDGRSCNLTYVPDQRLLKWVKEVRERRVRRPQAHIHSTCYRSARSAAISTHSRERDPMVRNGASREGSRTDQSQGVLGGNTSGAPKGPIGDAEARVIEGRLLEPDTLVGK